MASQSGMNRRQKNAEIRIQAVLESMAARSEVELTELPSRRNALVQDTQRIEWIADALEQISAKVWPEPAPKGRKARATSAETASAEGNEPSAEQEAASFVQTMEPEA